MIFEKISFIFHIFYSLCLQWKFCDFDRSCMRNKNRCYRVGHCHHRYIFQKVGTGFWQSCGSVLRLFSSDKKCPY